MTRHIVKICLVLVCLFHLVGCKNNPTAASISGNTYVNKYFGFSFDIPEGWVVLDKHLADNALQNQIKVVAWSHGVSEGMLQSTTTEVYQLLNIFQDTPNPATEWRSSITISAVKISTPSDTISAGDLLAEVMKVMARGAIPYRPLGEITECFLGGRQFSRLDVSLSIQGTEVYQAYVLSKTKGHALLFIFTSDSKDSLSRLVKTAESVTFQ